MPDVDRFRAAVRERRRAAGRTQQQLARAVGLHPDVLSRKLHGAEGSRVTARDAVGILVTLAGWGTLSSRADALDLLRLLDLPAAAVPATAWRSAPLAALADGPELDPTGSRPPQPAPRPAPLASVDPAPGAPPWAAHASPSDPASEDLPRLAPVPPPAPVTRLVGRLEERTAVARDLAASRLVTLTGVGGTGKTRLALQVAEDVRDRFPDGVAFVDLAPVHDPALLAVHVLLSLGVSPQATSSAETQLVAALRPARLLLLVDNLEHLLDEAPLLGRLLAAGPGVRVLATSRIRLRLYGEHEHRVPPLRDDEAVRLFVERARAVRGAPEPQGADLAVVADICGTLDRLPLAIELAASRTGVLSLPDLRNGLHDRMALLVGGPRDLPQRQRTLRAALDWSFALLTEQRRRLAGRLGVFAGPFDPAAAAAVCSDPGEAAEPDDLAEALLDLGAHSLLEQEAATTGLRFRLLQSVRDYLLVRLREAGDESAVRDRHLHYCLERTTSAVFAVEGSQQVEQLDRLGVVSADVRSALAWCAARAAEDGTHVDEGLRLLTAASLLWRRHGPLAEAELWFDRLLRLDDRWRTARPATRTAALVEAGLIAAFAGDYAAATARARAGIAEAERTGDALALALGHRVLAETALALGDPDAERACELQLRTAERAGDLVAVTAAHNMLGEALRQQGRFAEATGQTRRALAGARRIGNPQLICSIEASLGEIARDAGEYRRAARLFRAALRRSRAVDYRRAIAYHLEGLAVATAALGDERDGLRYLGAAEVLRRHHGALLPPADQALLDRTLDALLTIAPDQRRAALDEGRSTPLDEVVARALGEPAPDLTPRR